MTSCKVCPGECAMSSAVMTVEEAPTIPATCRPPFPSPGHAGVEEFEPVPGAAGLPDLESGSVVRIAVPVGALPEYGLDIVQGGSKTTVDADVLVGQDGLARAIRLVSAEESATQDTRSRR